MLNRRIYACGKEICSWNVYLCLDYQQDALENNDTSQHIDHFLQLYYEHGILTGDKEEKADSECLPKKISLGNIEVCHFR